MSVRTYGKEEKQAYVEDYKKSGETIARDALENGIPETTLRGWIKEDQELLITSSLTLFYRILLEVSIRLFVDRLLFNI